MGLKIIDTFVSHLRMVMKEMKQSVIKLLKPWILICINLSPKDFNFLLNGILMRNLGEVSENEIWLSIESSFQLPVSWIIQDSRADIFPQTAGQNVPCNCATKHSWNFSEHNKLIGHIDVVMFDQEIWTRSLFRLYAILQCKTNLVLHVGVIDEWEKFHSWGFVITLDSWRSLEALWYCNEINEMRLNIERS